MSSHWPDTACTPDRLLFQPYSRAFWSWKEIAESLVEDSRCSVRGIPITLQLIWRSIINNVDIDYQMNQFKSNVINSASIVLLKGREYLFTGRFPRFKAGHVRGASPEIFIDIMLLKKYLIDVKSFIER
jgi:hypothetical protein